MAKSKKEKKQKKQTAAKKRTHVCLVLDRSGSMSGIHKETVDGINKQIAELRNAGDLAGETTVSLIQFDDVIEPVFLDKKPDELKEWAYNEFIPRGSTAMRDGIWRGIAHLKTKEVGEDTAFLVCVISDGWENASKEVTHERLQAEIKSLQDTNKWTFTYMLANCNAEEVALSYGSPASNSYTYTANSTGTNLAYTVSNASLNSYVGARSKGMTNSTSFFVNAPQSQTHSEDLIDPITNKFDMSNLNGSSNTIDSEE